MSPDALVLSLVCFPVGWFMNLAGIEAAVVATHKWDKACWKLLSLFGSFLMGLAFLALVWHLPR
jgi:hypothetical protein